MTCIISRAALIATSAPSPDVGAQIADAVKAERERIASWHDREAAGAMNSLHCGSENGEYRAANRLHDFHKAAAASIRALAAQEGGE